MRPIEHINSQAVEPTHAARQFDSICTTVARYSGFATRFNTGSTSSTHTR